MNDKWRIFFMNGRWVLQRKFENCKNWIYYTEGTTPAHCFGKLPFSAGLTKDITFQINMGKKN